jgi:tRNA1(Val) A37 N6-methylase TrmN6
MTGPATAAEVTEDRLLDGRVRLRQPADGYRAAIDPVFLAAAVPGGNPGGGQAGGPSSVLDLGCGVGAAALCLLARLPAAQVTGLELQPRLAALARDNAALNGWANRFEVVVGDIAHPVLLSDISTDRNGFDEVICNPPHHRAGMAAAPDPAKATANREARASLNDWVAAALAHVRQKGSVTFIHRADRLDDLLAALRGRAGGIIVFPLWPKPGEAARRVLVRARKGVRVPLTLAAGLVLHTADGRFTTAAERVLREGHGLAL